MVRVIAFLLLLFTAPASAEQYRGVSSFAATHPRFPCDRFLAIYQRAAQLDPDFKPAMALLWGTFGYETSCAKRFTELFADREHLIEIHFDNGPGRRNKRLHEGEFFPEWSERELNERLESFDFIALGGIHWRVLEILAFVQQTANRNTHVWISRQLEDNYTAGGATAWEAHVRTLMGLGLLPPFAIVANPHRVKFAGGAEFYEVHGLTSSTPKDRWCIANEDGNFDQTAKRSRAFMKRFAHCQAVFLWRGAHQGVRKGGDFMPPRSREFVISDRDIEELSALIAGR